MLLLVLPLAFAGTSGPAPIPAPPNFHISSNATYLCKGQINYIPIIVTDGGTPTSLATGSQTGYGPTMQNTQLSVASTKNMYPAGNVTATAPNINPGNSSMLKVPAFVNANASTNLQAQININYYYDTLYSDSETRNLSFLAQSCPSGLNISIFPKILTQGVIQNITVNLTNSRNASISSLLLHLTGPSQQGTLRTTQPTQVALIPAHSSISMKESLFIARNSTQIQSVSVPLNVTATFYNGTNLYQVFESLPTLASGIVDLETSGFTVSPSIPSPLSVFSISFVMTDIGTTGASAMTVTPIPPKGFSAFGSNSTFVGDIGADTQTPVTFSMIAGNSIAPGTYSIPIRLNYLNNLRQNITVWANTTVTIAPAVANISTGLNGRTSSSGSGLFILILIIAIIVLGYLYYKERKALRKHLSGRKDEGK